MFFNIIYVKVSKPQIITVHELKIEIFHQLIFCTVNASQAGAGNLEIIVAVNGKNVPNYVQSEGNAKFRVNFKPQEAAMHSLSVRFNGEPVPGSPFTCKVISMDHAMISGHNLKMAPIKKPVTFTVDPKAITSKCEVSVTPPSNVNLTVTVEPKNGKYNVKFIPTEVGRHNVNVILDGEPIKGAPFACNVYDVTKVCEQKSAKLTPEIVKII